MGTNEKKAETETLKKSAEEVQAMSAARRMLTTAAHRAPEARTHDDNVFLMGYSLGRIDGIESAMAISSDTDPDGGVFDAPPKTGG